MSSQGVYKVQQGMKQAFGMKKILLMVAEGTIEANHELVSRSDITCFDSK
jgi:hypothetical protein